MEAIILAGGFGTRLAHIVSDVPKPMAPVCSRPFLRFIVDDIISKGVTKIVMAVGHKKESIIEFFGEQYRGVDIIYSPENAPLGTGGAIKQALSYCNDDNVFIFNGDTFFDVDLMEMSKNKNRIVVATKIMHDFSRYGTVEVGNNGVITKFKEKVQTDSGLINGGIYYIQNDLLASKEETMFSFESDVLETTLDAGDTYSFESKGYFIDIGVPDDYEKAQTDMLEYVKTNKIAFFDRDGTINVNTGHLHKAEDMVIIDGMPQFIKKWADWGYKIVVVTNQAGIAKGYYTENDMHELHNHMKNELIKQDAKIDAFYFCPHHPDFTGECECRKPNPGMIKRALFEFDADAKDCILFGDKVWDIEAAQACGVFGVMVD